MPDSTTLTHTQWTNEATPQRTKDTAIDWIDQANDEAIPWCVFSSDDDTGTIRVVGEFDTNDPEAYRTFLARAIGWFSTELADSFESK